MDCAANGINALRQEHKLVLIDCWRMLKGRGFEKTTRYALLGAGVAEAVEKAVNV